MSGLRQSTLSLFLAGAGYLLPGVAISADIPGSTPAGHGDPFSMVFAVFTLLLLCAVAGRFAAIKLKQSPVLGELVIGIIVGALVYQFADPTVTIIRHSDLVGQATTKALYENKSLPETLKATLAEAKIPEQQAGKIEQVFARPDFPSFLMLARSIELFASLGVILLLFMVGLECSLEEMRAVGGRATGVAVIGMIAPFVMGFGATKLLCPGVGARSWRICGERVDIDQEPGPN